MTRLATPSLLSGLLAALLATLTPAVAVAQSDIVGDWKGALEVPGASLPLVFHIAETDGSLGATMDSPAQGAIGIPVDTVTFEDGHVTLRINAVAGGFEGDLTNDTLTGSWSQSGMSFDLTLERSAEDAGAMNRPQEPKAPFPYDIEEVRIASAASGVMLAGTLTLPRGDGPFPTAILISGSGPQNRDEALMGHRPFLVLADHLTRHGVAVLRLDDRGVGESTGSFVTATSTDFADDTLGAVRFLDARADVGTIGLIGHSEGGLVAPMVANRSAEVGFVVLMAGPGLNGEEILYRQSDLIIKASGGSDEQAATNRAAQAAMFAAVKEEDDPAVLRTRFREALAPSLAAIPEEAREAQVQAQLAQLDSPWFRYFLTYDPVPALRGLEQPVLAINGEKDTQVPPQENLEAIAQALAAGGNDDVETVELPGLNHLFQTAVTGAPNEYATIEETMSPRALELMSDWILARF
jgi:pimeloyl-ACP methyl ester carboxylesterase